ncbi:MAG TPA: hypothetical protein VFU94_07875 [Conexibacter sp.]|nr:hypothetical protein [Conexibacter sp.]
MAAAWAEETPAMRLGARLAAERWRTARALAHRLAPEPLAESDGASDVRVDAATEAAAVNWAIADALLP